MFDLLAESSLGRRGTIHTKSGDIPTPMFFPVGTAGAMRGLSFEQLRELGAEVLLANTYHLHIQPGEDVVQAAGGLHTFIGWDKPILTDSGGFQVFSLEGIRKITDDGVQFQSHRDGSKLFIGPIEAMRIQHKLNSDIIMCFDECPPSTAPRTQIEAAVDRTLRWAAICKQEHERLKAEKPEGTSPLLFGIVQGGLDRELRRKCSEELIAIGFDGYAVGGLAVGETEAEMYDVLDDVCPVLPSNAPRYLMGVGRREQHRTAIAKGIDIFDCVLPMREARHGRVFLSDGSTIRMQSSDYKEDFSPIDADSPSAMSRHHTKAYLHHLFRLGERYAETIACAQNMALTIKNVRDIRESISS